MNRLAILILLAILNACTESGDEILTIDASGTVVGLAYLDRDGNNLPTPIVDAPVANLQLAITTVGRATPIAIVTTDSVGFFRFTELPVGTYRVIAANVPPGDTISVLRIDSARVTVTASDTAAVVVTLGYATAPLGTIVSLPAGRRIAVTGTALNAWPTFGDSTIHFADSTGAVRAFGVPPLNIAVGDTVRMIATVGQRHGGVALVDPAIVFVQRGNEPTPAELSTAQARQAGGRLDAALVRVHDALVVDASSLTGGDILLTVNDGSGDLEVLVDVNANIGTALPVATGAQVDVVGVLAPDSASGDWQLKPRRTGDVVVRYLPITIAQARTRQPGQFVVIEGVALNNLSAFGDRSLHVKDATGTMRVFSGSNAFISTGDSVTVLGAVNLVQGQPALTAATPSVIVRVAAPNPGMVTTTVAGSANSGQLDAALVRVTGSLIAADTLGNEIFWTIDDNSGPVLVILDPDATSMVPTPALNASMEITGVLVPVAPQTWALKPRNNADIRNN